MWFQARVWPWFAAAVVAALAPSSVNAGIITQSASLPLTTTDFGAGNGQVPPLVFQKFDSQGGSRQLTSVTLNFSATIQNQFGMQFVTPATITDSVASGNPSMPGPSITLYQPDGVHALITAAAANDPTFLSRTVSYGSGVGQTFPQNFSSTLPTTSPYYIAPASTTASNTLTLTNPADLAVFNGTGSVSLPVSALAFSSFTSSSGNGFGSVTTQGTAQATISYNWSPGSPSPELVPEPAAAVLWGIGLASLAVAHRLRRKPS